MNCLVLVINRLLDLWTKRVMQMFLNYPHTANNLLIVVLTCLLYVQYSRVLFRHSRASTGLTWAQKSFFLQTSSICMSNLIAALIYVYMNFFATPSYFVVIGHICWQLGHGGGGPFNATCKN
nr:7TM GPCR chemoreceptor domain containing protein [Haemonchus contortus]